MEISTTKIYYTNIPQNISDRKKCIVSVFNGNANSVGKLFEKIKA
jgi:hypothetical protein